MWQLKHVWSWHRNNAPPHVPQPSQGLRLCKLCWSHLCFILESLPFYTNQDLYEYFHNSWHFPTYNSWGNLQMISSRRISSDQSNLIVLQILLRNSTLVSASKKIIWQCQQFWEWWKAESSFTGTWWQNYSSFHLSQNISSKNICSPSLLSRLTPTINSQNMLKLKYGVTLDTASFNCVSYRHPLLSYQS